MIFGMRPPCNHLKKFSLNITIIYILQQQGSDIPKPTHLTYPCYHAPMEQRERILVSACLLGEPCRYDGASQPCENVMALATDYDLVPVCPEQLGGLPTPRTPSELQPDGRVIDRAGRDRTEAFRAGAQEAVRIARAHGCTRAILKAKSPSCGTREIYDGTFTGTLVPGKGVTAVALEQAGIEIAQEDMPFA